MIQLTLCLMLSYAHTSAYHTSGLTNLFCSATQFFASLAHALYCTQSSEGKQLNDTSLLALLNVTIVYLLGSYSGLHVSDPMGRDASNQSISERMND